MYICKFIKKDSNNKINYEFKQKRYSFFEVTKFELKSFAENCRFETHNEKTPQAERKHSFYAATTVFVLVKHRSEKIDNFFRYLFNLSYRYE